MSETSIQVLTDIPRVHGRERGVHVADTGSPRDRVVVRVGGGHERQREAPARWPATLLRGGVPRVMTWPTRTESASAGPDGPLGPRELPP